MSEFDEKKLALLRVAKKILEAENKTIQILQTNSAMNLRTIERKAKVVKDPNPLTTMMSQINTKYPITISRQKAIESKIPEEFLSLADSHQHGRQMCSMEAIDWYLTRKLKEGEVDHETIDVLYSPFKKAVKHYFSYDWANSSLSFGRTHLERREVPTNAVELAIPKNLQNQALINALMPDLSKHHLNVGMGFLSSLKTFINLRMPSKLTLLSQIRTVMQSMDEKRRYLPTQPNTPVAINMIRHAFSHQMYMINPKKMTIDSPQDLTSKQDLITDIGLALLYVQREYNTFVMESVAASITIDQTPLREVCSIIPDSTSRVNKVPYAIFRIPVTTGMVESGVTMYSEEDRHVTAMRSETKGGCHYVSYAGLETISFIKDHVRGRFEHDGPVVLNIQMTRCIKETAIAIFQAIGVYCRWSYVDAPYRDEHKVKAFVRDKVKSNLKHFLMEPNLYTMDSFLKDEDIEKVGICEFVEEAEIAVPPKKLLLLEADGLRYPNQRKYSFLKLKPKPVFPPSVACPRHELNDFFPPPIMLRRKIQHLIVNIKYVKSCIDNGIWDWKNDLGVLIDSGDRARVSYTARSLIRQMRSSGKKYPNEVYASMYMFCGYPINFAAPYKTIYKFTFASVYQVNLAFDDGIIKYFRKLIIHDVVVGDTCEEEVEPLILNLFLPGYKITLISDNNDLDFPVKSHNYLMKNRGPDGEKFVLIRGEHKFLVVRDYNQEQRYKETIQRGINQMVRDPHIEDMAEGRILKRLGENLDEPGPSKRQRIVVRPDEDSDDQSEGDEAQWGISDIDDILDELDD